MDLNTLQVEHEAWERRNFPDSADNVFHSLAGMTEELGELAHAVLKAEQGIRGSEAKHMMEAGDAVGDIFIYCAGLCNKLGLDMDFEVTKAWKQVKARDWNTNKESGKVA